MGDVVQIENVETNAEGVEKSLKPMPDLYPGDDRLSALETLIPAEETLTAKYERLVTLVEDGDIKEQLKLHLGQNREHLFTQEWLLKNARKIKGID